MKIQYKIMNVAGLCRYLTTIVVFLLVGCSGGGGGSTDHSSASTPIITRQPTSVTVLAGTRVDFSVVASGDAPLSYQWQRNDIDISGATAASYTVTATTFDSGSVLSVVIHNASGSVTSTHATLTVKAGPDINLLAGALDDTANLDGIGFAARFNRPNRVTLDSAGNVYVSMVDATAVRKITQDGVVTTSANVYAKAVAVDSIGNVYAAGDYSVSKISPTGVVTTFAGGGASGSTDDGAGLAAHFNYICGIAVDGLGNVYVADTFNHTIRKISPSGVTTTLAGAAGVSGSSDGTGLGAHFSSPYGIAVDGLGNVYVADTGNQTIRKITPSGVTTTLAGAAGLAGSSDGTGAVARFNNPNDVAVDQMGNVFVVDTGNNTIRMISPAGVVTTLAGIAGLSGSTDGTGTTARFYYPQGVAVDQTGNVFVADGGNGAIRKIARAGTVTTLAGMSQIGSADGMGAVARFNQPNAIVVDGAGIFYVADTGNNTIRKIMPSGDTTTFAGSTEAKDSTDGAGAAARFNAPRGVAVDQIGNIYVADTGNNTIRKITSAGLTTTLAGVAGVRGSTDGLGTTARFNSPEGIAVDQTGNVFVADSGNNTIRKITPEGVVTTLVGTPGTGPPTNNVEAATMVYYPLSVAVDGAGNIFFSDSGIHGVRKLSPSGVMTTLSLETTPAFECPINTSCSYFSDFQVPFPRGVTVDRKGNLYVADGMLRHVVKISPDGVATGIGMSYAPIAVTIDSNDLLHIISANAIFKVQTEWP